MATLSIKDASCAREAPNYISGSAWTPGRTVCVYVDGNYVGVLAVGPSGVIGYGNVGKALNMPGSPETAGAKPVVAKDSTDSSISATGTVTLT